MNKILLTSSLALIVAGILPAVAYHTDTAVLGQDTPLTAGDWVLDASLVTSCESMGPSDDRNAGAPKPGVNGLCATGQNDATGSSPYDDGSGGEADAPPAGTYVKLDLCDRLVRDRTPVGGTQAGACAGGQGLSLASIVGATGGRTNTHGFTAEVGAFSCFIPTEREALPVVSEDWALYYDQLYAWWSYEGFGVPPYTAGDAPGAPHTGTLGGGSNADAFHGHATVFPIVTRSEPGASRVGSVETSVAPAGFGAGFTDDPLTAAGGAGLTENGCGGSPAAPPSGTMGPVVRGPSGNGASDGGLSILPVCAQLWDGVLKTTFPCLNVLPDCSTPAGVATVEVVALNLLPATAGQTVTGTLKCGLASSFSVTATTADIVIGSVGANADATTAMAGAPRSCTRTPGGASDMPSTIDTIWLVQCLRP